MPRRLATIATTFVVISSVAAVGATPANASVITVTTTADTVLEDGLCSLREAINAANLNTAAGGCVAGQASPTVDKIAFALGGSGVHTITPSSALPLTQGPVFIDGTSQSGYAGAPLIELNGTNAGNNATGLHIGGDNSTIRALTINRFSGSGIHVSGNNNLVDSSFIGTDSTGMTDLGNAIGISVAGQNNSIGDTNPDLIQFPTFDQYRNVISGNGSPATGGGGIFIANPASSNTVVRNDIGVGADGSTPVGNAVDGVLVFGSSNNTIGSPNPLLANVIGTNGSSGVEISNSAGPPAATSSNNVVVGNYIGTNPALEDLGNDVGGVSVAGSTNMIGGKAAESGNTIAFNGNATFVGRAGVIVNGTDISVLRNSIFDNDTLGIDLGADGVTANDEGDEDDGSNDLQNFPVIESVREDAGKARVFGSLDSQASTDFRIEFFTSPACDGNGTGHGEGRNFRAAKTVTTNGFGIAEFSQAFGSLTPGTVVTATATKMVGGLPGPTSEFSACFVVPDVDLKVVKEAPQETKVGGRLTYSITIKNRGTDPALGVTFSDVLPRGVKLLDVSQPGGDEGDLCFSKGREVFCDIGPLGAGSTTEVVIQVRPLLPGTLTNTASVTTTSYDPSPANDSDSVDTLATCEITGTADPDGLEGTPENDVICGLGGGDDIFGRGGKDFIVGGNGGDYIEGNGGGDDLYGNDGDDELLGGDGNDDLNGGPDTDTCRQGAGTGSSISCEGP